jgi:hypothetical protein
MNKDIFEGKFKEISGELKKNGASSQTMILKKPKGTLKLWRGFFSKN